jgi:hypothetical protein
MDLLARGFQIIVDNDVAFFIGLNTGFFDIQPIGIGDPL